ncbi:hypothetical protein [Desulfobacula sp.]
MRRFILIFLIVILCTFPAFAQENYCKDKEPWKEWDKLVQKYPHNMDIQMLHAVRIGFCKKIEDSTITFEVASDAFNHLHETVYKKDMAVKVREVLDEARDSV